MGNIYLGISEQLALRLRDAFGVKTFIETGTYKAGTAMWAAKNFEQVYTIEGYERYYQHNVNAYGKTPNVEFIFGDSRVELGNVLKKVKEPAIVWLDAHFLGNMEESAGGDECPIREELAALRACKVKHYILIDDLHLFKGDLPRLSDRRLWLSYEELVGLIPRGYYVTMFEDQIIAVPEEARAVVDGHMAQPERLNIIVTTSNKYLHILPGFSYFFNKFWSAQQPVTVMRYEIRPPKQPPNFYRPSIGRQADFTWSSGLMAYLETVRSEHALLMLEDYYLDRKVDQVRMAGLLKMMQDDKRIVKVDLTDDRLKFPHRNYTDGFVVSDPEAAYQCSIQAAIWRVDFLLRYLEPSENAWQFEKHGTGRVIADRRARKFDGIILGCKEPPLHYVNAVGGEGRNPGQYDRKKIPGWMWKEMEGNRLV